MIFFYFYRLASQTTLPINAIRCLKFYICIDIYILKYNMALSFVYYFIEVSVYDCS